MLKKIIDSEILDEMNVMVFILDTDMTIQYANKTLLEFSGVDFNALKGRAAWEMPLWEGNVDFQNEIMFKLGHVMSNEEATRLDAIAVNQEGLTIEMDLQLKPVSDQGMVTYIMAVGYNITELVKAKKFLTKRERQISAFFKYSTQGYFFQMLPEAAILPQEISVEFVNQVYEAQRIESINSNVFEYLGLEEEGFDHGLEDILVLLGIRDLERITTWQEMIQEGIAIRQVELVNQKTNNKVFLDLKFVAIMNEDQCLEGNFCIVSNITQKYVYERELNFLANKDPLTGLNNRRHFQSLASSLIENHEGPLTAAMLDIDKFKSVNDTYGHDVGDIAIRSVADSIESRVGGHGIVGRYGGEEFIVLINDDQDVAYEILESIRSNIEGVSINYGAGNLRLTISIGSSSFQASQGDAYDQAVIHADKALLEAKATGRNRTVIYNEDLHGVKAIDRLTGTYTRNALLYKHDQFHENLRRYDVNYGMVIISLKTLIVSQFEILRQYIKQTSSLLNGMLRDQDIIGRYDDLTFVILIDNVNDKVVENIGRRILDQTNKLSGKFDNLIEVDVHYHPVNDWSIKIEDLYACIDG